MNRFFPVLILALAVAVVISPWFPKTSTTVIFFPEPGVNRPKPTDSAGIGIAAETNRNQLAVGKELFVREWLPEDRRSHAGDGLGPLFNARSCAACHHLGGVGGAGSRASNVTVVSAFLEEDSPRHLFFAGLAMPKPSRQPDRSQLARIHPALLTQNSFVLRRFAIDQEFEFESWKHGLGNGQIIQGQAPDIDESGARLDSVKKLGPIDVHFVSSQRRAPSLFGASIINQVPVGALEEVAASQALIKAVMAESPRGHLAVSGRVARLQDGRIGRFGWKGQIPTLREFTLQACALELGLEVPAFPQSTPPWNPSYRAPGLDLSEDQCHALVNFVSSLPPPARQPPETEQHAVEISDGKLLFDRIGCAVCHRPRLGKVEGIYSDLLLHDMGEELSDNGMYGGPILASDAAGGPLDLPVRRNSDEDPGAKRPKFGVSPTEWRTPPLWGLRYLTSFMHDGRADSISVAIACHRGEGFEAAENFKQLAWPERQQLELFLQSLGVPALEK
jgi:CxxC motif-containing protein (DUF1111 family)